MDSNMLPLGTVVSLKNEENKYAIVANDTLKNKTLDNYDYYGVVFPGGYSDTIPMKPFNEDDIKDVIFIGYVDQKIATIMANRRNKNDE